MAKHVLYRPGRTTESRVLRQTGRSLRHIVQPLTERWNDGASQGTYLWKEDLVTWKKKRD